MNRISILISNLRGGGAQRVFINLANEFARKGYKVDFIIISDVKDFENELSSKVSIISLNKKKVLFSFISLIKVLKKREPDILLSGITHVNVLALIVEKMSNFDFKLVTTVHGLLDKPLDRNSSFKDKLIVRLAKVLYKKADALVAVSNGVAKNISNSLSIPISEINVIFNPIVSKEALTKGEEEVNHPWFINKKAPIILSIGSLGLHKDYMTAIKAIKNVISSGNEVKYVILGDGERMNKLKSNIEYLGIENNIELLGFKENPYKYIKKSDILLLTSKVEGFGNVIVEAMMLGTPVVSTDCPSGPREILEDGKWGRLAPVGEPAKISKAIILTLQEETKSKKLIQRSKDFSTEKIADEYLALFKSIS